MHIPKNYFHDRLILLLLSSGVFLTVLNTFLVLLRLDSSRGSYIVQYRANLGLGAFKVGDSTTFISFVLFGIIVLGIQVLLSMRAYKIRRPYAIAISAVCILLLMLTIIVGNALLALR